MLVHEGFEVAQIQIQINMKTKKHAQIASLMINHLTCQIHLHVYICMCILYMYFPIYKQCWCLMGPNL